jgi:hypothetical protein
VNVSVYRARHEVGGHVRNNPTWSEGRVTEESAKLNGAILTQIELRDYNERAALPGPDTRAPGGRESVVRAKVTHWAAIFGRDVNADTVASS